MKIFHVHCLHGGEWESYWPVARKELKKYGKITHQFPDKHNGAWTWTEVLRELGHEVIEFDYKVSAFFSKESMVRIPWLYGFHKTAASRFPLILTFDRKKMNRILIDQIKDIKPDIYITYPGELIYPETLKTIQRTLKVTTVHWLGRDPIAEGMPDVIDAFPYYDFVFTIDPPNVNKFKRYGAKRVFYLPLACYKKIHKPLKLNEYDRKQYSTRVSFVGTLFDDRPEFLNQIVDTGIHFWTHSWNGSLAKKYPRLNQSYRGVARGERMLKVLSGSDITINRHRAYNSIEGTNMRTFEAAGCRSFQIVEYKKEIERMFRIGKEIEVYYDIPDLKDKIDYYLEHPRERKKMAVRAQEKVYTDHTYHHRFTEMFDLIQSV